MTRILYDGPCACGSEDCHRHIAINSDGEVWIEDEGGLLLSAELPDGALSAPAAIQWSQDAPCEEGDYFVGWYDGDEWIYNHAKVVWLRRNKRDSLNVIVRGGYKTVDNMADYIGHDVWWSTAHVPQPPNIQEANSPYPSPDYSGGATRQVGRAP